MKWHVYFTTAEVYCSQKYNKIYNCRLQLQVLFFCCITCLEVIVARKISAEYSTYLYLFAGIGCIF